MAIRLLCGQGPQESGREAALGWMQDIDREKTVEFYGMVWYGMVRCGTVCLVKNQDARQEGRKGDAVRCSAVQYSENECGEFGGQAR